LYRLFRRCLDTINPLDQEQDEKPRAVSGEVTTTPASAAINFRRPMVIAI
jgi:hypothetical protein